MLKRLLTVASIATTMCIASGCVNLYTRCPFTEKKIERTYQSTGEAYSLSIIISWPQIMSDNPGDGGFMVENLLTIPIGFLGMCDTACEGVLDTVFLPADLVISDIRKNESDK